MILNNIMMIGNKNSFMVSSILRGLERYGYKITCIEPRVEAFSMHTKLDKICIVFMSEEINHMFCTYFSGLVRKSESSLIVIGEQRELNEARTMLPVLNIIHEVERPVDMEKLCEFLNQATSGDQKLFDRKRLLVVDDDTTMLKAIKNWLSDKYTVFMANSGAQAITMLAKETVDLILLDYEMPVADGPAVMEMLSTMEETRDIPVIFLTSKKDRDSVMKAVSLRASMYLLKSLPPGEIVAKIDSFFETQMKG